MLDRLPFEIVHEIIDAALDDPTCCNPSQDDGQLLSRCILVCSSMRDLCGPKLYHSLDSDNLAAGAQASISNNARLAMHVRCFGSFWIEWDTSMHGGNGSAQMVQQALEWKSDVAGLPNAETLNVELDRGRTFAIAQSRTIDLVMQPIRTWYSSVAALEASTSDIKTITLSTETIKHQLPATVALMIIFPNVLQFRARDAGSSITLSRPLATRLSTDPFEYGIFNSFADYLVRIHGFQVDSVECNANNGNDVSFRKLLSPVWATSQALSLLPIKYDLHAALSQSNYPNLNRLDLKATQLDNHGTCPLTALATYNFASQLKVLRLHCHQWSGRDNFALLYSPSFSRLLFFYCQFSEHDQVNRQIPPTESSLCQLSYIRPGLRISFQFIIPSPNLLSYEFQGGIVREGRLRHMMPDRRQGELNKIRERVRQIFGQRAEPEGEEELRAREHNVREADRLTVIEMAAMLVKKRSA